MNIYKKLLFYEKDDYYDFKDTKTLEGYSFVSITKFINNQLSIEDFDSENVILDISALTAYQNIQVVAEPIVYELNTDAIFICDISKKETIKYELRFVFDTFENIDEDSFIRREIKSINEDKKLVSKRHKKIIDLDNEELVEFFHNFNQKLYGHSKFKDDFDEQIRTFRLFNKLGEHKILSFFIMGESGVGKTEVARAIFKCLKGEKKLAKINFGNYSNEFSLSSLIGSARGYIGSDDGEIFMKVRETDIGILLIDEFEKSNSTLFNYFLEVLESGKMTNSLGEEMDLNGFIIIFTSNISKEDFKERISPELRSRFDHKCIFTLLSDSDKMKYIEFRAESLRKKVNSEFEIELGEELKMHLLKRINVSSYKNMRDVNKQIKKEFLEYFESYQNPSIMIGNKKSLEKVSFKNKLLGIFTN